jgi:hypothetical protein
MHAARDPFSAACDDLERERQAGSVQYPHAAIADLQRQVDRLAGRVRWLENELELQRGRVRKVEAQPKRPWHARWFE